ncbi:ABC transporter permease [Dyadobacter sp. CY345]|uniref:ABC transporter permease n=1 Tax=Dyadobacter sp. CY345 TaxID=2909335 RepID=UPI001F381B1B|nr:ABC transporter permease [Dyadobacter sp. CY345]MCF2443980.1 ABC transporter permease [Dyadobacter sp. CY345]
MLHFDLLRNHMKTSVSHLVKDRLSTVFNLVGLSTAMTCVFLISLWVADELSIDKFHENDKHLYQVMIHQKSSNGVVTSNGTGERIGDILRKEFPEIALAVTSTPVSWFQNFSLSTDTKTIGAKGNFISSDYFKAFSFPLSIGNKNEVLKGKKTIAISEELARKLFDSPEQAMGKVLEWKWQSFSEKCLVSGVFENFPTSSSQKFDFILSMDAWNQIVPRSDQLSSSGPFNNFIVLKEASDAEIVNKKIAAFSKISFDDSTSSLFIRKYSDSYLHDKYENGTQTGGRILYVRLFSIIGIIILTIACINFMNLSTAKASRRAKEVGVKKALGASRSILIVQFLSESLMLSFAALLLAIFLTWLLLPQFNFITNKNLSLQFNIRSISYITAISTVTGLIAGSYPAFYLSRFSPSVTLKGSLVNSFGELLIRKGLVVFQFSITISLVVSVLVVYRQIRYLQEKDLGYNKDNIIYFEMDGLLALQPEPFIAQLKAIPGVVNASSSQQKIILPDVTQGLGTGVRWEGKNDNDEIRFFKMPVNYDLLETIGIKIKEGRSFSKSFGTEESKIILNETAVKAMGIRDPVGKTIKIGGNTHQIIGITNDFHFNSMHEPIKPFIFYFSPAETTIVMAKIEAGKEKQAISQIRALYKKFNPGYLFNHQFLDHDYQVQYTSEKLTSELAGYLTILTMIISCLGLLGLTAFTTERRKKEIGIRKVLGANLSSVIILLTKDLMILISIAIGIGFPLAYWFIDWWLQNFAYHVPVSLDVFIIAGLLLIIITLTTVGYHSLKAAFENTTSSLKVN